MTAGLAESNGSLPPWNDFKSHLQADWVYTGISSGPNANFLNGSAVFKVKLTDFVHKSTYSVITSCGGIMQPSKQTIGYMVQTQPCQYLTSHTKFSHHSP